MPSALLETGVRGGRGWRWKPWGGAGGRVAQWVSQKGSVTQVWFQKPGLGPQTEATQAELTQTTEDRRADGNKHEKVQIFSLPCSVLLSSEGLQQTTQPPPTHLWRHTLTLTERLQEAKEGIKPGWRYRINQILSDSVFLMSFLLRSCIIVRMLKSFDLKCPAGLSYHKQLLRILLYVSYYILC